MAWPQKVQKVAAAQAREGKAWKKNLFNSGGLQISPIGSETGSPAKKQWIIGLTKAWS